MFRGVRRDPLPTEGMTTDKWMTLPIRGVWISELYATQPHLVIEAILGEDHPPAPHCADPLPHVVIMPNGDKYLEDGHHRTIRTALSGRRVVVARVLDLQEQT
jgi:hypothetical protein